MVVNNSGGSPYGLSHYMRWTGCVRKAWRDQARIDELGSDGEPSGSPALDIGTVWHGYLENYYKAGEGGQPVPFTVTAGIGEDEVYEAERLFRAYRNKFSVAEIGQVLAVEKEFWGTKTTFGIEPFTGRLDLVTLADDVTVANWRTSRDIAVEPGVWIIEHKTSGKRAKLGSIEWPESDYLRYATRLQMYATQMLWNEANPTQRCLGVLTNVIYKLKVPEFKTFVIPAVNEDQEKQLQSFLRYAIGRKGLGDIPDASKCLNDWSACRYLLDGSCNRQWESK